MNTDGNFTVTPVKGGESLRIAQATLTGCKQDSKGVMVVKKVTIGELGKIPTSHTRRNNVIYDHGRWKIDDFDQNKVPRKIPHAEISGSTFEGAWKQSEFAKI